MSQRSLRELRTFCTAARQMSFQAAAAELCITASAVSHQIKELEDRMGLDLFERKPRGLAMTAAGRVLFDEVDPLIRGIDEATNRLRQSFGRYTLRVRLPAFFSSELFIPRLSAFSDAHASIDIRIATDETVSERHQSDSDVSIVLADQRPDDAIATALFRVRLVPACSRSFATSGSLAQGLTLDRTRLILHKRRPNAWYEWASRAGIPAPVPRQLIELDSMIAVARAAERGLGIALLPLPLAEQPWFGPGGLVRVSALELPTRDCYYVLYRSADLKKPAVRALVDWIMSEFGAGSTQ
jgi:LysR family glycine cleavage system transcriptional activator